MLNDENDSRLYKQRAYRSLKLLINALALDDYR